jgi:hypothetical protein
MYLQNATGILDLSYDGFILANSLENVNLVTKLVQPDYVFTDAEKFPSLQLFTDTIGQSANAAARRLPGEADCELAKRISNEFLASWMGAMNGTLLQPSTNKPAMHTRSYLLTSPATTVAN